MEIITIEKAFLILGISMNSNESEIKTAYHNKSKELHPDKSNNDHRLQAEINEAYEIAL